jgi:hypothetical protein
VMRMSERTGSTERPIPRPMGVSDVRMLTTAPGGEERCMLAITTGVKA